jgi:HlyD family secretion protein
LGIDEQRVDVVFDILSPEADRPGLGHGFAVFMRIVEWESAAALQVPLGALFRRGDGWAVFVVDNGVVREQPVDLGRRGDRMAEIVAGLSEGDAIITHPSDVVAEGVTVIDRADL